MTPKYRGDDDDWLDAEKERGGQGSGRVLKGGKKKKPEMGYLALEEANGTVAEVFPNQCKVIADGATEGERVVACTYRRAKLPTTELRERAPVAVGDRVRFERISQRDGVIEGIVVRRNFLARPAPERAMRHTLVANIDVLVIVAASREPVFTPGLVDRFLVAALAQKIDPILCVTKMDLFDGGDRPWTLYSDIGFRVIETCAKTGTGLEEVRSALDGKLATFCGHSGVGKTSLLNALLGFEVGRTAEVSTSTGKGQHTTTGAYLIPDSNLIDTPGIRAFGLLGIAPADLRSYFPEFQGLPCAEPACEHREEEGCAARELPRYSSYRRMLESLLAGEN
jgi:ribosome biogenesis GTPase